MLYRHEARKWLGILTSLNFELSNMMKIIKLMRVLKSFESFYVAHYIETLEIYVNLIIYSIKSSNVVNVS